MGDEGVGFLLSVDPEGPQGGQGGDGPWGVCCGRMSARIFTSRAGQAHEGPSLLGCPGPISCPHQGNDTFPVINASCVREGFGSVLRQEAVGHLLPR